MPDLDQDERLLAQEQELDPTHSQVDALEGQVEEQEEREEVAPDRRAAEVAHFEAVSGRVAAIFEGQALGDDLEKTAPELTDGERLGLRLLEEVVHGKDSKTGRIVYAERRLEMLELALATLQPAFALALVPELADLRSSYDDLVEEVVELRDKLDRLDAAQEELMALRFEQEEAKDDEDEDDKPADGEAKPEEVATPEKKPGLLGRIFGRGKNEPAKPEAAEVADEDAPKPSTLYGDDVAEEPPKKSTVYEPD